MNDIIVKTRKFLKDNNFDYLLVNSTNEYLAEYSDLKENSRYILTGFSGSCGDALLTEKDLYLFVDGRYHQQADNETNPDIVSVEKLKIGDTFLGSLVGKISENSTIAIVSKKVSVSFFEEFKKLVSKKNVKICLLDNDPICDITVAPKSDKTHEKVYHDISGASTEEKIASLKAYLENNEALLISDLEEISYVLNKRDFSVPYSSKIRYGKLLVASSSYEFFDDEVTIPDNIEHIFMDKNSTNLYTYNKFSDKARELRINPIKELKSIKTSFELAHYKSCFKKTDDTLYEIREFIENNDNLSEADIANKLEELFKKNGALSLSFKSIVAIDKNSALAHYSKSSPNEILKDGSLVLIDCGAYYDGGYATDATRVFVKGNPTALQKEVYTIVLKGFLKAINYKIKENATGYMIDAAARKVLNADKRDGFEFSHSLGHGIGISVHENPPSLSPSKLAKSPLVPNMCFTIEPGLYNPNYFGVRLENSCYLDKSMTIKSFSDMCFEEKLINFDMLTSTEKRQLKAFKVL